MSGSVQVGPTREFSTRPHQRNADDVIIVPSAGPMSGPRASVAPKCLRTQQRLRDLWPRSVMVAKGYSLPRFEER
jgi:hypothetical protein